MTASKPLPVPAAFLFFLATSVPAQPLSSASCDTAVHFAPYEPGVYEAAANGDEEIDFAAGIEGYGRGEEREEEACNPPGVEGSDEAKPSNDKSRMASVSSSSLSAPDSLDRGQTAETCSGSVAGGGSTAAVAKSTDAATGAAGP